MIRLKFTAIAAGRLLPGLMITAVLALAGAARAGQTRTWSQGDFADFQKGVIHHLSVRSDGVLTLAPKSTELLDTSSPYLWALAEDSKGNLYAGGGTGAKLYRIERGGQHKVVAELEGLEVHAIAIDAKDRVYAATSPDGKVYRVAAGGKPEVFFDPKAKYIWALAFNPAGDLFVATGEQGEVYRVTPDGKGKVFFKSDETHVRSMAIDPKGNLILGTEPSGLIIRVSPAGEGFVLYQAARKEVTAVAVAPDGTIYAAAVGTKGAPGTPPAAPPAPPPQITITATAGAGAAAPAGPQRTPAVPPPSLAGAAVTGGTEVYRIDAGGTPRRVWNDSRDIVYAIALDASGRVLLGTGNKGAVYRVESPVLYTALLSVPCTQITAFQAGRDGRIFAATGNVGKIYEVGPALEHEGTIEGDVFDSGLYSAWGRLTFEAHEQGGKIAIATRSGNVDQPQKNWSAWSAPIASSKGERMASPPARFLQWRAVLTAGSTGQSPELESVDAAYLPKNLEPRVDEIEITPPNYRFPPPPAPSTAPPTLSLPALGKRRETSSPLALDTGSTSTPTMTYAKGFIGARWTAGDPNGDNLVYTVMIRGAGETEWKLLKDKVKEKYWSWDSTAFPDGDYRVRVIASDSPSNPPAEALTGQMDTDPFVIDNTPPRITGLAAARSGDRLEVRWHAADALNNLRLAEYSLDGGDWTVVAPAGSLSDSLELDYVLTLEKVPAGEHTIAVRVADDYDNQAADKAVVR